MRAVLYESMEREIFRRMLSKWVLDVHSEKERI